jgi:hypothetical protein
MMMMEIEEPSDDSESTVDMDDSFFFEKYDDAIDDGNTNTNDDDDASTAATSMTEEYLSDDTSSNSDSSSSSSTRATNRVRFNLNALCIYHTNNHSLSSSLCYEDLYELWYDSVDYRTFKRDTFALAKQVANAEARNRNHNNNPCASPPHSYQQTILQLYQHCCCVEQDYCEEEEEKEEEEETREWKHLVHWVTISPNRIGLEKWALKDFQYSRTMRRLELKQTILELQKQINDASHTHNSSNDDKCHQLRRASVRLSRPARLFARYMATSQAAALSKNDYLFHRQHEEEQTEQSVWYCE